MSESLLALNGAQQIMLFIGFIAIACGIVGAGFALNVSLGAYAGCNKEHRSAAFIPAVMPAAQAVYSFAISFLMMQNMARIPLQAAVAGVICGLPCLCTAIGQGKTAATCIKAIAEGQMNHGQALIATGATELCALAGFAGGFLVMVS